MEKYLQKELEKRYMDVVISRIVLKEIYKEAYNFPLGAFQCVVA